MKKEIYNWPTENNNSQVNVFIKTKHFWLLNSTIKNIKWIIVDPPPSMYCNIKDNTLISYNTYYPKNFIKALLYIYQFYPLSKWIRNKFK